MEDAKRQKIEGDVSVETVAEIIANITNPTQMLGPEVSCHPKFVSSGEGEGSACSQGSAIVAA